MIIQDLQTDAYHLGRKATLVEVRGYQERGLWTKALRSRLVRSAVYQRKQLQHKYPEMTGVIRYLAGRIVALRSQTTVVQTRRKRAYVDLASRSFGIQQERLREATVYTHADSWDWNVEDECDLIERSVTPTLSVKVQQPHDVIRILPVIPNPRVTQPLEDRL
jgi:hypothetical protein